MPKASTTHARYGTKLLIQQALDGASGGLPTRQLVTAVRKVAGKFIPYNTVFQAAKSLVKAGTASSNRIGREYVFSSIENHRRATEGSVDRTDEPTEAGSEVGVGPTQPVTTFPHKLDPGQVLVLSHDGKTVVTLSNVHGKAQIERHALE
jgi:hypothetical protein